MLSNYNCNWINLAENSWDHLLPLADKEVKLGKKKEALFELFSLGVVTNRDEWVYDEDENNLANKLKFLIHIYNEDAARLIGKSKSEVMDEVDYKINGQERCIMT